LGGGGAGWRFASGFGKAVKLAQSQVPPMRRSSSRRGGAQPRCGASLSPGKIRTGVEAGTGWARSYCEEVEAEKVAEKIAAVAMCMRVFNFLEMKNVSMESRQLASFQDELRQLFMPKRPGALSKHCRMFNRFSNFVESDSSGSEKDLKIDGPLVMRWINDLINHQVGSFTPGCSLGSLRFFANLFEFDYGGDQSLIHNRSMEHRESRAKVPRQAEPFSCVFLIWLENMVLDEEQKTPDRAARGRRS